MIRLATRARALLLAAALAGGCAPHRAKHVPIDARPTPAQPGQAAPAPAPRRSRAAAVAPAPATLRSRIASDTLAVRAAIRRCGGRTLLPEQESTIGGLSAQLAQVRAAIAAGDLSRAASLAREARSLASSLACP